MNVTLNTLRKSSVDVSKEMVKQLTNRVIRIGFYIIVASHLAACSDPKIDVSSYEAYKASVADMGTSLDNREFIEFDKALRSLNLHPNMVTAKSTLNPAIHKLNFDGVIELAVSAKRERAEREKTLQLKLTDIRSKNDTQGRKSYFDPIEEVKQKQKREREEKTLKKLLAKRELAALGKGIFVEGERIQLIRESRFSNGSVSFRVVNNSDMPVGTIAGDISIRSKGRAIHWAAFKFHEVINGGINPGETKSFEFSFNPPKNQPKNVFPEVDLKAYEAKHENQVSVFRAENIIGRYLFSNGELKQLEKLSEKYPEITRQFEAAQKLNSHEYK